MVNALIATIYAMSAATVSGFLFLSGLAGGTTAALAAVVQILVAAQIHSGAIRQRERRKLAREMSELRHSGRTLHRALAETRDDMGAIKAAMESKAKEESRKIVAELQVLESLVREFAGKIATKAKTMRTEPPRPSAVGNSTHLRTEPTGRNDILETIRAALEENRVDLYLQPIVTLPQRKVRFYEALSRLRGEDGSVIMPAQYVKVAAPVGLMSVLDNLLLFRCVQLVRRLSRNNRDIAIFCNIAGDTLADAEFFPQFLEYMHHNRDLAPHIVFEFAQGTVLGAGARGEENLRSLSGLGFALSLDHVETLAFDPARLKALGFRYLKLGADMFLGGLTRARSEVAAEDLKALLARQGISLIVERIEQERSVIQLLDFGVDLGQGYLFGKPRAVREDTGKRTEQGEGSSVIPFRRMA